jgi:hypothetical protein
MYLKNEFIYVVGIYGYKTENELNKYKTYGFLSHDCPVVLLRFLSSVIIFVGFIMEYMILISGIAYGIFLHLYLRSVK